MSLKNNLKPNLKTSLETRLKVILASAALVLSAVVISASLIQNSQASSQTYTSSTLPQPLPNTVASDKGFYAQGSGFFINEEGYIATAAHVIENTDEVYVLYKDALRKAKVVSADYGSDTAIIKIIEPVGATPFLPLADPVSGEPLYIAGFPAISKFGLYVHVTNANLLPFNSAVTGGTDVFEMAGRACQGNSGGAIINRKGQAVGILVLGYVDKQEEDGVCSDHTGARYLFKLRFNAYLAGIKVYKAETGDIANPQRTLYESVKQMIEQEKIVFIQVHIKSK